MITRKAYGGAYCVMGSKDMGCDVNVAWPTAQIAVMGASGAVGFVYRSQPNEAAKMAMMSMPCASSCSRTTRTPGEPVRRGRAGIRRCRHTAVTHPGLHRDRIAASNASSPRFRPRSTATFL